MPDLYALLVGINNYPVKPLQGCINDVTAVEEYLTTVYQKDTLKIKRITDSDNDKPGRDTIIKAFDHYIPAKENDVCLFYYSGHGSFSPAPEEFWTDTSGFVQSFVCQDSRLPGGRDLMDKEMSFLIWKTMFDKPAVTFVAITDCCHSGTITKAIDDSGITDRMMTANATLPTLQDYLGYDFSFVKDRAYELSKDAITGKNKITVAQGNHIHLAASKDNQTSKELIIDGKKRGAFTHSLLKILYGCGGQISYRELIDKTTVLVKNLVPNQLPVSNINGKLDPVEKETIFLSKERAVADPRYPVYYDGENGKWRIQAGLVNGVSEGDIVHIEKCCDTKIIASPFPDFSFLEEKAEMIKSPQPKDYYATVTSLPDKKLKLSFAPGIPESIQSTILESYKTWTSGMFTLLTEETGQYIIRTNENAQYFITLPGSDQPIFEPLTIAGGQDVAEFFNDIDIVSKWLHLQEFNNPSSKFSAYDYEIKLYRSKEAGIYNENNFEEVKYLLPINDLYYKQSGNQWEKPAVRFSITNNCDKNLWVTSAYLGFDYSISPEFFGDVEIKPGITAWLRFRNKDIVKMEVDKKYQDLGYNEITEYLKLFISTDKIELSHKKQEGLQLVKIKTKGVDMKVADKGISIEDEDAFSGKDWKTETIGLRIIKPLGEIEILAGKSISLEGITIEAHSKLNAKAGLTGSDKLSQISGQLSNVDGFDTKSADQLNHGKDIRPPHEVNGNSYLEPFDLSLSGTRSGTIMDVLELFEVEDREVVTGDDPLIIQTPSTRSLEQDEILPVGYDPETRLYYPLGYYSPAEGKIYIETLPSETASETAITQKSFFGSIKIYFQKVIGRKIGITFKYPRLAIANVDNELNVTFDDNEKNIETEVGKSTNILLFIHGIIGDTESIIKCIKTPVNAAGDTLKKDDKTLVLAFDYENLNTPIEETAKALGEKLTGVGLKDGHQKNLIIVAHSMGGLVSRWFVENDQLKGHKVVSRLIMLGTPNNGSHWADVRDLADTLLTYALNGAAFLKPWMFVLSAVGRVLKGLQVTIKQMDPKTGIYTALNGKPSPEIPYTVIAGNTQKIIVNYEATSTFIRKLFKRIKKRGVYDALDLVLFKMPNDIAVTDESIAGLKNTDNWTKKPVVHEVACDHLNYFIHPESLLIIYNYIK